MNLYDTMQQIIDFMEEELNLELNQACVVLNELAKSYQEELKETLFDDDETSEDVDEDESLFNDDADLSGEQKRKAEELDDDEAFEDASSVEGDWDDEEDYDDEDLPDKQVEKNVERAPLIKPVKKVEEPRFNKFGDKLVKDNKGRWKKPLIKRPNITLSKAKLNEIDNGEF